MTCMPQIERDYSRRRVDHEASKRPTSLPVATLLLQGTRRQRHAASSA